MNYHTFVRTMFPKYSYLFFLTICLVLLNSSFSLAAKLSLPVELTIENGDYNNSVVRVTKNGKEIINVPGKNLLRIKLDFNNSFLLFFSKPGYITKSIEVNTTVSAERERQSFEPYKIGVKLFKQYQGINIVVYNQPVAKIRFSPIIDDFDYDVDYTKSILSKLEPIENQLEVRATEERRLMASGQLPKEGFEIPAAASERFAKYPKLNEGKETLTEPKPPTDNSKFYVYPSRDPVDNAILNGGTDTKRPLLINQGNDVTPAIPVNNGEDIKAISNNAEGKDKPNALLKQDLGSDKSKTVSNEEGMDNREKKIVPLQNISTTSREFIVEPNRTITLIKVNDGKEAIIYRKVLYNWGGLYYFKNLTYSVSQNIFELETGEK